MAAAAKVNGKPDKDLSAASAARAEDRWKPNTIGVLGELAADLATAAYGFHRLEERYAQKVRYEGMNEDSVPCDPDWQSHMATQAADARDRFDFRLRNLHEHLETDSEEFFVFILDAKEIATGTHILENDETLAEGAFNLIAEWGAIRELISRVVLGDELPSRDAVIVLIGRLEILIERMQVFFREAGLEPDHFRR